MRSLLLACFATAAAALAGCAASPAGLAGEATPDLRHAPPDPGAPAATSGAQRTFAVRSFDLGGGSPDAWKQLGLDIDGASTTAASTGLCKLAPGASPRVHEDGADGIDNSFGANLVPLLSVVFGSEVFVRLNASLATGYGSDLLQIGGLEAGGDATVDAALQAAPFPRAWIAGSTFATAPSTPEVRLVLGSTSLQAGAPSAALALPVTHVQIVAPLADDAWTVQGGVLSGILPAADTVKAVDAFMQAIDPDVSADVLRAAEQQVLQSADILVDGTQDPARACDGISIGLGFTADARPVLSPAPLRPAVAAYAPAR